MTSRALRFFLLTAVAAILGNGCAARSSVRLTSASGRVMHLSALSREAKSGVIAGARGAAWFGFNPEKAEIPATSSARGGRGALEVSLLCDGSVSSRVSLGFLNADDRVSAKPVPRPLATVSSASGSLSLRLAIPDSGPFAAARGFAVSVDGGEDTRVTVLSAAIVDEAEGWERSADSFWAGFGPSGGSIDQSSPLSTPVHVAAGGSLSVSFLGAGPAAGSPENQQRCVFALGDKKFGFRLTPGRSRAFVPSFLVSGAPGDVVPVSGAQWLAGVRSTPNAPYALTTGNKNPLKKAASGVYAPIYADPNMIVEWPQTQWRRADFEVFAWDRFPSVLIFDTADYAVQDRLFKRLAFFVEKDGYRGRLVPDAELAGLHGYNAHDYRAESLAAFFEAARAANFPLTAEEIVLRDILSAEGIIVKNGNSWGAGAGAVISISRESPAYLRYLFVTHEGFHGIYFVDADYRAKVSEVYRTMDRRAIGFLETYFTVVGSLGYDTDDPYLMENEFMAYLMQQPLARVPGYFTENIAERYRRYGGAPSLEKYVQETKAADFERAARELGEYAFSRWGVAGGRLGLYFFD